MQLVNKRTILVVELKCGVSGIRLSVNDAGGLAQLFYETYLVCLKEKKNYTDIICVYAYQSTWHIFVMNFAVMQKKCKKYYLLHSPNPKQFYSILHHLYLEIIETFRFTRFPSYVLLVTCR